MDTMSSVLATIKQSMPNWLLRPKTATDGIKIGGIVVGGITTIIFVTFLTYKLSEKSYKYNHYTKSFEVVKNADFLLNKVCIITGCNSGIGKETAKQLYAKGSIVVMACRNKERANKARSDILQEIQGQNPQNLINITLDLGNLNTIDQFVQNFNTNNIVNGKLDYLINNAGVMAFPEFGTTIHGIERQFGINHIGHFYLTNKLLPILKKNKTRIINVSSVAQSACNAATMSKMLSKCPNGPTPDIIKYDGFTAGLDYYAISKLCNVLFTRELNTKYNKDGIVSLCLMPGVIETGLQQYSNGMAWMSMLRIVFYLLYKTVEQGAATTLRCVTITDDEIFDGNRDDTDNMMLYFDNGRAQNHKIQSDFKNGKNKQIDKELWEYSRTIIHGLGFELNSD